MAEAKETNSAKLGKIPLEFQLGEKTIDSATIRPATFASFAECIALAHSMTAPAAFAARLLRVRMARQVVYHVNGTAVPVSVEEVLRLPVPDFHRIVENLDTNDGKAGKIIRDGDGVNKSVTYELGTPLSQGKDRPPIRELEFLAPTYGDIEDILAADGPAAQTTILLKTVARPIGDGVTLLRLTDAIFAQLTVADGTEVSNLILPRFLGQPSA